MDTSIFYFSSGGNSLTVARDLAGALKGELVSIPRALSSGLTVVDSPAVGFVFPVYHATFGENGIPYFMERFIRGLENLEGKYIFAVCSHCGYPGFTMENLAALVAERGGYLSVGITVKLCVPYPTGVKLAHVLFGRELFIDEAEDERDRLELLGKWRSRLEVLVPSLLEQKRIDLEIPRGLIRPFMRLFNRLQKGAARGRYLKLTGESFDSWQELTEKADRSYRVTDSCTGCGICVRVCPVKNLTLVDKKPRWGGRCANCSACFYWCPQEAITGLIVEYEKRRHLPGIKASDFFTSH